MSITSLLKRVINKLRIKQPMTLISLHSVVAPSLLRRQVRDMEFNTYGPVPMHKFIKTRPISIVTDSKESFNQLIKLQEVPHAHDPTKKAFTLQLKESKDFNIAIEKNIKANGPIYVQMLKTGINLNQYYNKCMGNRYRVKLKYTDKCLKTMKNINKSHITTEQNFINKIVKTESEARLEALKGFIYIKAMENGFP